MVERPEDQEQNTPFEPTGLPADLFDDPAKYDSDIPLWKRTVNFVRQYGNTRTEKRVVLLDQTAASVVRNPLSLGNFLDNLSLISQLRPEINVAEIEALLIQRIEREAGNRADLARWTPDKIEELVRLGIDGSGETKEVVEKMKEALFNSPKNPEEATDLFYNAAWAMVSTEQHDVREEIFSMLCCEKSLLKVDSLSVIYFAIGGMLTDDSHIKKNAAIRGAMEHVGSFVERVFNPQRAKQWVSRVNSISAPSESVPLREQVAMVKLIEERINNNPTRYQQLREYSQTQSDDTQVFRLVSQRNLEGENTRRDNELSRRRNLPWPENLIKDPDEPLLVLVRDSLHPRMYRALWEEYIYQASNEGYQKLTERPVQITEDLELDVLARGYESAEQKSDLFRQVSRTLLSGQQSGFGIVPDFSVEGTVEAARTLSAVMMNYDVQQNIRFSLSRIISAETVGKLSSVIEFHRPTLSIEQTETINGQNSGLRDEIRNKFTRSVGKRGYQLIIADPSLKTLGYESMSFRQGGNGTNVSLVIDGQIFEFSLDSDYRIKPGEDVKRFLSPQDKAWLELLTLSHLKKLMCTEEDSLSDELVGGKKQHEYYRKQKIGRIEHLRRLPPGQNFSTDAYLKCLKSDLPAKQLDRINKMRAERGFGGTKETGVWTYISGIEKDIDTGQAKPVKVAFASATDDMRKVIPLGEISTEERERIEKEILAEMNL